MLLLADARVAPQVRHRAAERVPQVRAQGARLPVRQLRRDAVPHVRVLVLVLECHETHPTFAERARCKAVGDDFVCSTCLDVFDADAASCVVCDEVQPTRKQLKVCAGNGYADFVCTVCKTPTDADPRYACGTCGVPAVSRFNLTSPATQAAIERGDTMFCFKHRTL